MLVLEYTDIIHQIAMITKNGFTRIVLFFDILTGILKSFKTKKTSSSVSLFGIAKHSLIELLMIVTYLISLTEN